MFVLVGEAGPSLADCEVMCCVLAVDLGVEWASHAVGCTAWGNGTASHLLLGGAGSGAGS